MRSHLKHVDALCNQPNSFKGNTTITIGIPRYFLKVVEQMCYKEGTSRSEIFRRAMRYYIENQEDFYDYCDIKVKEYDKRREKVKVDEVQQYMKANGYNTIRRLD